MQETEHNPEATSIAAQIGDVRAELLSLMSVKQAAQFGQPDAGSTSETPSALSLRPVSPSRRPSCEGSRQWWTSCARHGTRGSDRRDAARDKRLSDGSKDF
jgi:hypothetical protein